jgi:hypothetical protein
MIDNLIFILFIKCIYIFTWLSEWGGGPTFCDWFRPLLIYLRPWLHVFRNRNYEDKRFSRR